MKIFNIAATGLSYFCAGASFAANQPIIGLTWIFCGIANHILSLMY